MAWVFGMFGLWVWTWGMEIYLSVCGWAREMEWELAREERLRRQMDTELVIGGSLTTKLYRRRAAFGRFNSFVREERESTGSR